MIPDFALVDSDVPSANPHRGTYLLDTESKDLYFYVKTMENLISKYGSILNNDYENDRLNYNFVVFCKTCFNWEKCQSPSGDSLSFIPDRLDPNQSSFYCSDCDNQARNKIRLGDVKNLSKNFLDRSFITCVLFCKTAKIYRLKTITFGKTSYQTTEPLSQYDISQIAIKNFLSKRASFKMP